MHDGDFFALVLLGIEEGVLGHAQRGVFGDQFDTLHDARNDGMLNAGIFTFGVLANGDEIDVRVRSLVTFQSFARPDVGEQIELFTQCQIQRLMTLSNR